jgi:uncharacterized membrane protein
VLGAFLSMLAAITFALNNATSRRGVISGTVVQALAITVPMGVPLFLILVLVFGQWDVLGQLSMESIFWLSCAGIIHFVWGRYCNYRAAKAIGANLMGAASQSDILFTLALAMIVLDEKMTPMRVLGIALVLCGPLITMVGDLKKAKAQQDALAAKGGFQPKYVEGYIFAFLSGTGYGVSPIFVRLALRDTDPGAALAGGLVSYLAASVVVAFLLLLSGQFAHARQVDRKATLWFVISGVTVMASQMFRYMALSIAPVSVVQPIQRLSLLLRFFFGWLINREHEVFSGKVWLSTIIALIGALLLTFTTEQVIAWVPMPEGMVAFLRMEWP